MSLRFDATDEVGSPVLDVKDTSAIMVTDTKALDENVQERPKLSKSALKKKLKQEKMAETRAQWKMEERAKKKAKKMAKRALLEKEPNQTIKEEEKKIHTTEYLTSLEEKGSIVIDLNFDPLMTEKEIVSLSAQICRSYSIIRRSKQNSIPLQLNPFSFSVYGLGKATNLLPQLKKAYPDNERWSCKLEEKSLEEDSSLDFSKFIYLSGDADEVLDAVDETVTYVIGGLVDRNRYKNIALERAKELGMRTMKLPLAQYAQLSASPILTIVHVTELLCKRRILGNWSDAIEAVLPKRKVKIYD